jgi:membrane protein required for colicin V production
MGDPLNIAEFIRSFNLFDLLIILILFGMFILGFVQGTVRRLLGLASILFSFLLAANLREPLGNFLAANWTQFDPPYAVMVGFGTMFVAASLAFTLVIQGFYKKTPLSEKYLLADEILGGVLGVVQGLVILGAMIIILDSAFEIPGVGERNELILLRGIHGAYDPSVTAAVLRGTLIPAFYAVFGLLIPEALRNLNRPSTPTA